MCEKQILYLNDIWNLNILDPIRLLLHNKINKIRKIVH